MNKICEILLCVIHSILIASFFNSYGILVKNPKYDIIYITLIFFKLLHWTMLNGECILTYLYKKNKNKNYKAGQKLFESEYSSVYGNMTNQLKHIHNLFTMISFYLILSRNNISLIPRISIIILYQVYYHSLHNYKNHSENEDFLKFNNIMQILITIWGIYFYTNNYYLVKNIL